MVEHAGAAGCGAGIHIAFRTGLTETLVNAVIQELPIPLDRRIGTDFLRRKLLQRFLHHIQHHQISIFIQNGTDRTVDHLIIADFLNQGNGPVVGCKILSSALLPLAWGAAKLNIKASLKPEK